MAIRRRRRRKIVTESEKLFQSLDKEESIETQNYKKKKKKKKKLGWFGTSDLENWKIEHQLEENLSLAWFFVSHSRIFVISSCGSTTNSSKHWEGMTYEEITSKRRDKQVEAFRVGIWVETKRLTPWRLWRGGDALKKNFQKFRSAATGPWQVFGNQVVWIWGSKTNLMNANQLSFPICLQELVRLIDSK